MSMLGTRQSFVKQRSLWYLIPLSWLLLCAMFGIHVLSQIEYLPGGQRPHWIYFAIAGAIVFTLQYVFVAETLRTLVEEWNWVGRLRAFGFACLACGMTVGVLVALDNAPTAAAIIFAFIVLWPAGIGALRHKR